MLELAATVTKMRISIRRGSASGGCDDDGNDDDDDDDDDDEGKAGTFLTLEAELVGAPALAVRTGTRDTDLAATVVARW
jgi:hypothetical protein